MCSRILWDMRNSNRRLSAEDWLLQGFVSLSEGGHSAIKAEVIAKQLNVSKGSFYWHFSNVPSYKSAMLSYWLEKGTLGIIDQVRSEDLSARDQLYRLISIGVQSSDYPFDEDRVEAAIREWAKHEVKAAEVVSKVESQRLKYLVDLFKEMGFSVSQSKQNARLLYAAMIGLPQLPDGSARKFHDDLSTLLDCLLNST